MSRTVVLAAAISLALAACSGKESTPVSDTQTPAAQQPADASTNPLLSASTLPFQAPPFDKIKDSDYLPAFNEGMKQHLAEVRKIADNPEPATFDNTIEALERSGETLTRVSRIFFGLVQADTNDARQKIQEEVAPKLADHQDDLPKGTKSGLAQVIEVLKDVPGISFTHFMPKDVVRHPLVQRIVEAYERFDHKDDAPAKDVRRDA